MRNTVETIEVDSAHMEDVLRRVEEALEDEDATFIRRVFESYLYVTDLVEDKNTTIRHLRQLLFGKRTEKTAQVVGDKVETSATTTPAPPAAPAEVEFVASVPASDQPVAVVMETEAAAPVQGHGRNGADAYRGAERIDVAHSSLQPGDPCPACGEGTVYAKAPGVLVRVKGQAPLTATIYQLQKLRCHLCGEVFTAAAPAGVGEQKYDATAGAMIGLLKYGVSVR